MKTLKPGIGFHISVSPNKDGKMIAHRIRHQVDGIPKFLYFLLFGFASFCMSIFANLAFAGLDEAESAMRRGDYETAIQEFSKLSEGGDLCMKYNLGTAHTFNAGKTNNLDEYLRGMNLISEVATERGKCQGHAQYVIGLEFDQAKKYKKAIPWYRRAAENKLPIAIFNLGMMYFNGDGVEENWPIAFEWLHKAAMCGYPASQFMVGLMYGRGQGVSENMFKAHKWMIIAARNGNKKAKEAVIMNERMLNPFVIFTGKGMASAFSIDCE